MDLSIIIVSYNTKKLLRQCLASIYRSPPDLRFEVIVVDNASTDGSPGMLRREFPQAKLIINSTNTGFARANNLGARSATGEFLLLLNSDTLIIPPALNKLHSLARRQQARLATCTLLNSDDSIQPQGGALPNLSNIAAWMLFLDDIPLISRLFMPYQQRCRSFFTSDRPLGWLAGTAMLVDRRLFQSLQGFDPNIFMYGEDVEFCYRAHLKGVTPRFFASPKIYHFGQQSSSARHAILGEFKGLLYFYRQHRPASHLPLLKLLLAIGTFLRLVIFGIIGSDETKRRTYRQALSLVRS